jgi:hypothetical protein
MLFGSCWNICGIILLITFIDVNSLSLNNEKCLNHCSNDGVCLVIETKVQCYCLPEWEGERCDKATIKPPSYQLEKNEMLRNNFRNAPCSYVPTLCQNGGVCFLNETSKKLACKCPYDWDGARCEERSVCYEYCFNNGLCEVQTDGTPKCTDCGDNYDGTRCQSVKTTTTNAPPSTTTDLICTYLPAGYCNKGTCAVGRNAQVYCICPPTYTGNQCQTATGGGQGPDPPGPIINPTNNTIGGGNGNACASNPCFYNNPCYNTGNSYYCLCGANYQGANCQIVNG